MRLVLLLFSLFLSLASLPAQEALIARLQEARRTGRVHEASLAARGLMQLLEEEEDPFVRVAIRRALWIQEISLSGSGLFDFTISALACDGDDIWIGTRSGDIARYSLSERRWMLLRKGAPSLAVRSVNAILAEEERIWFLSYGSALIWDKRRSRALPVDLPDHASYRGMQSLLPWGEGVLIGTQGRNLRRVSPAGHEVFPAPALRNVSYLARRPDGRIWAGTEGQGLFLSDPAGAFRPFGKDDRRSSAVRALFPLPQGFLAGSYGGGLFLMDSEGAPLAEGAFSEAPWVTDGCETAGGYCFSTLGNGLIYREKGSGAYRSFGIPEGLSALDLTGLEYAPPYLIAATQSRGVWIVHENFFL